MHVYLCVGKYMLYMWCVDVDVVPQLTYTPGLGLTDLGKLADQ